MDVDEFTEELRSFHLSTPVAISVDDLDYITYGCWVNGEHLFFSYKEGGRTPSLSICIPKPELDDSEGQDEPYTVFDLNQALYAASHQRYCGDNPVVVQYGRSSMGPSDPEDCIGKVSHFSEEEIDGELFCVIHV